MKPEKEKLHKLEPLSGIPPAFHLKEFKYDEGLLTLGVQDRNHSSSPILIIHFEIFSLRITTAQAKSIDYYDLDESLINLKKQPGYDIKWSLFTVENSHYVEWFHEQNVGIKRDLDIVHYLIKTTNEVIEVLDLDDPSPTFMWS